MVEYESSAGSTAPPVERSAGAPAWVFVLVLAAAVILRFWNLGSAGISHGEAGALTAGALGVGPYGEREMLLLQAPPLVPAMFSALFDLWGPVDTLAMGVIALFGVATVVALFLAGRRWVGDAPALIGAAALAGMELHLVFSRQALADVPFALFVVLAMWAITAAVERRSLGLAALAGLTFGAAILTKYQGFLALVLAVAWISTSRVARRPTPGGSWRYGLFATMVAAVPAAWLAFEIERRVGLSTFLASRSEWGPATQTVRQLARSSWEWVSPFVLVPAALGILVMARRRESGDRLVLVWIAVFLLALPFCRFEPRSVVPLLPPLALAAGVGIDAHFRLLAPAWSRVRTAALSLVVLAPGAWSSRDALRMEDRGYALAGRYLVQARPDPGPDLVVTQHSLLFYFTDLAHPFVCYGEPEARELLDTDGFRFLVTDLRLVTALEVQRYLDSRKSDLKLVAEIGNPLPEPTIVSCAGFEGLDAIRSSSGSSEDRATLEKIRVWRLSRRGGR